MSGRNFSLVWSREMEELEPSPSLEAVPVYFPSFNPSLRPLRQSIFKSLIGTISSFVGLRYLDFILKEPSQFDDVKPSERTVATPLFDAPFDPHRISYIRKQRLIGVNTVNFLLPDYVFKYSSTGFAEAFTLEMLRSVTSIPVPKVYQMSIYPPNPPDVCIVMEYIPGRTLEEAWPQIGFFAKLRIMWTLRGYIQQLRRLRREIPGPLDGSNCYGPYFSENGTARMSSYSELVEWWNHKILTSKMFDKKLLDVSFINQSSPLVFSHGDIHPSNLILGDDGKLYMIDWQCSGFYPEWYEYACAARHWHWLLGFKRSWKWLLHLVVGYYLQSDHIENVLWAIECNRDNVLSEEHETSHCANAQAAS